MDGHLYLCDLVPHTRLDNVTLSEAEMTAIVAKSLAELLYIV